jgi:hypothetical protein
MRTVRTIAAGLATVAMLMVDTVAATAQSTLPADAAVTVDPLPGVTLQTEQVETGVLRVVNDGVRDLSRPTGGDYDPQSVPTNLVAGLDGSVWIMGPDEFYRIGDPHTYPASEETPNGHGQKAGVAPDGTLWALVGSTLQSFDAGTWTGRKEKVDGFDMQPDGTVWASSADGLVRIGAGTSPALGGAQGAADFWVSPVVHDFFAQTYPGSGGAPEIEVLVLTDPRPESVRARFGHRPECPGCDLSMNLSASGGGASGPAGKLPVQLGYVDMDAHGGYWLYQQVDLPLAGPGFADSAPPTRTLPFLVHVAGGPMTVYAEEEGVPVMGNFDGGYGVLKAAPDGSVWMTPRADPSESGACDGLAHFDGTTWTRYLHGRCVYGLDVAPDGTVWVQAGEWDQVTPPRPMEIYVIPPRALVAVVTE